jgi:hypothetical protein
MKTHLIQAAFVALALAAAGYAQSAQPLQVNVPFDFVAGSRTLTAGQYTVWQPVTGTVAFRSFQGAPGVIIFTNRVESPGRQGSAQLVFHRYGDRYFLSEVWGTDSSVGSQLRKTVQERELAQNSRKAVATIIAAR